MKESHDKKAEEFQHSVATGRMTQQQADGARAWLDKLTDPSFIKVVGAFSSIIGNVVALLLPAWVVWLMGRFLFHARFSYMQAAEIAGLALMISALGGIINLLLGVIYGTVSMNAGPILLVSHFDQANRIHQLLRALSLPSLWYVAVLSIGTARLSNVSFWKAAACLFALWAVLALGPIWLFNAK